MLTRGKLATQTDCNIETIRYYETIGLLPAPARTASGYRASRVSKPGDYSI
jgi:MerR family mercuric resistance operon transcriptional regulator